MNSKLRVIVFFSSIINSILHLKLIYLNNRNVSFKKKNISRIIDYVEDPLAEFSEGRKLFNIECAMCHRIGAKSTPGFLHSLDLKMNKYYFHLYLTQQDSLVESNDLYASQAKKKLGIINLASNHNYDFTSAETEKIYAFILAAYHK